MNTATQTATETSTVHPFEIAGLGKAPFKYLGEHKQDLQYGQAVVGTIGGPDGYAVTTKPGGTCAYCGTSIVNMFKIRSADGKVFRVGSDCALKVGGEKIAKAVSQDVRRKNAAATKARGLKEIGEALELLGRVDVRADLASQCHRGQNALEYVTWMLRNAGHAGKVRAAKIVLAAKP
jgi:hypothetical protein